MKSESKIDKRFSGSTHVDKSLNHMRTVHVIQRLVYVCTITEALINLRFTSLYSHAQYRSELTESHAQYTCDSTPSAHAFYE